MSTFLFAQFQTRLEENWPYVALVGLVVMVFFIISVMFLTRYRRCPSNQVLVIYGKYTGSPTGTRCLHGGARLVLPLVLLGLGIRILRHPKDAEDGGRIGIGLGTLVLAVLGLVHIAQGLPDPSKHDELREAGGHRERIARERSGLVDRTLRR